VSLADVEKLVRERTGIDVESLGPTAFRTAVENRMKAATTAKPGDYLSLLRRDAAEWVALLDSLVVPESWFFRGGRPLFDALAKRLMEVAATRGEPARALSIPCGIGEEPYSLAIALRDYGAEPASVAIEGWDISPAHLARAATGRYRAFSFRHMEAGTREHHFHETTPGEWTLRPEIRRRVCVHNHNLAGAEKRNVEPPFDVILCRNVFIYLADEAKKQAIANLERWLAPDGWLCVSHAEADRLPRDRFTPEGPMKFLIYRRGASGAVSVARKSVVSGTSPQRPPTPERARPAATTAATHAKPAARPRSSTALDPLLAVRQLADQGQLDDALDACSRITNGRQATAAAYGLLGVIHLAKGNANDAFDAFTRSLYLDPNHAESLEHLAGLCEQRGDRSRAAVLRKRLARGGRGGDA
jgi:chemotaxis protein methyltransferase WspC